LAATKHGGTLVTPTDPNKPRLDVSLQIAASVTKSGAAQPPQAHSARLGDTGKLDVECSRSRQIG
jgi:hypothetical protein